MKKLTALVVASIAAVSHAAADTTYNAFIQKSTEAAEGGKMVVSTTGATVLGLVVLVSIISIGIAMWKRNRS